MHDDKHSEEDDDYFEISFATNFTKKILLIEDNMGDVILFKSFIAPIKNYDIELVHVSTIYDAYKLLKKDDFDIIFLDLNLPDDFGISSIRSIKEYCGATEVIVLTGLAGEATYEEADKAGAAFIMVKSSLNTQIIENLL